MIIQFVILFFYKNENNDINDIDISFPFSNVYMCQIN